MFFLIALCIVVMLYLFAIFPGIKRIHSDSFDVVYAHRGLFDNNAGCPENSMSAFSKAVDNGYGIELDVHITKDDRVVVVHDENLMRMCGRDIIVEESTYEEIKKCHLLSTDERIPLLEDVLDVVTNKVPLIIEIKATKNVNHTCRVISAEIEKYNIKYCIESFNPLVVRWYKNNKPNVIRGQLSTNYFKDHLEGNVFRNFALSHLLFNFLSKPDFIAYNHIYRKSPSFNISTKVMKALPVAWTIRNQDELDVNQKKFCVFIFEGFIPNQKNS